MNDDLHPLKAFCYGIGGTLLAALLFGVAAGPMVACIAMSTRGNGGWWALAAATLGFAWLVGVAAALVAFLDRRGWLEYSPFGWHFPSPPCPPPFPTENKRAE